MDKSNFVKNKKYFVQADGRSIENQEMDFLTLDKIFVLDNFNIILDKKYFVRADGWGKKLIQVPYFNAEVEAGVWLHFQFY